MAFFQPARYVIGDIITRMWNWYVIGVSLIYITLYILVYTRRRITKADIGIIAMLGVFVYSFLIASLFNISTSNFKGGLIYTITTIGFVAYLCYGLEKEPKILLKGYVSAGMTMSFIHLLTILLYQNKGGMRTGISALGRAYSDNWFFLSHANAAFYIFFPVIIALFVYAYTYEKKLIKVVYAFLVFTLVCLYVQWSLAGFIGILFFAILLTLDGLQKHLSNKIIYKFMNLRLIMVISIAVELFLALFSGLSKYTEFMYLYFGKGQSIGARLRIWEKAIECIISHPIVGNGWNYESVAVLRLTSSHTHNILLEFLYCGGLIAVVTFIFSINYLQKQLNKAGNAIYKDKSMRVVLFSVVPFVLAATFDFYMYRFHTLIIYVLLWYLPKKGIKK